MKNKELEEKMANLYLNGYEPDGHGPHDVVLLLLVMEMVLILELESWYEL
jgi:hypothetical protein